MQGYVQVYTGHGKGKTTAALGLSIRAAGAGLKVFIAQFIKSGEYSELKALKRFSDLIVIEQFGFGRFVEGKPSTEDIEIANQGLKKVRSVMKTGEYNIIIMEDPDIKASHNNHIKHNPLNGWVQIHSTASIPQIRTLKLFIPII